MGTTAVDTALGLQKDGDEIRARDFFFDYNLSVLCKHIVSDSFKGVSAVWWWRLMRRGQAAALQSQVYSQTSKGDCLGTSLRVVLL